jgi:hypothetical protein
MYNVCWVHVHVELALGLRMNVYRHEFYAQFLQKCGAQRHVPALATDYLHDYRNCCKSLHDAWAAYMPY